MKREPDKGALKIHRNSYGPLQWSLASPAPGTSAKFRRWNLILIPILVFLVLGVFVVAEAPRTANDTHAPLKESASPAAVQHANSSKSPLPPIHGRGRNLSKDAVSGHHTT